MKKIYLYTMTRIKKFIVLKTKCRTVCFGENASLLDKSSCVRNVSEYCLFKIISVFIFRFYSTEVVEELLHCMGNLTCSDFTCTHVNITAFINTLALALLCMLIMQS
jgi:hypothetical protein